MKVEVVYALPGVADCVSVAVEPGTTLREAVVASGIPGRHPQIDLARLRVGVYGRLKPPDAIAAEGDRIEIYRLLAVDPKEARRRRASKRRSRS